jgi:light-regulated signal transduction histidine kinase (bacteriophytochrome)
VTGCAQILAQDNRGKLGPDADELIEHMVEGCQRMGALIEDLLTLSRVRWEDKAPQSVDTQAALDAALGNLKTAIDESGATISHGVLPVVKGDRRQLIQLLQNLIGNAIKYHASDPPQIEISAQREPEAAHLTVKDNGIGIEACYFERVFGVFQRLHTRAEYPGTGIGLALCKKIVDRRGGRIWIESTLGVGSTFHVLWPDADAAAHA